MSALVFDKVRVSFGHGARKFTAVHDVSLRVPAGRSVGLVGESGSGKSTLARAAVGLCEPRSGSIALDGTELVNARGRALALRRRVQMVFQDPSSCLDPRMSVGASLVEAIRAAERRDRRPGTVAGRSAQITGLLESVQLPSAKAAEYPGALSGGQRQRVALARALAAEPAFILADEITSALDVSVQGSVMNLLKDLQAERGFGLLFISHNLAAVHYLCDDVAVLRNGRLVEAGATADVLHTPKEDYTRELLAAVPRIGEPLFA
ncbi:ABC transporter ATP-binding protein [Paenarthrobacter sp. NPDC056912]|uniref:ABC transporter ATP-binding protein n=1 Tax=Paenarthrobacter sp. NPDC056912 TaxID=3345965 RepID=UPI0036700668